MKIWVNTIVNNEENFLWFAIMSVVDFVDKVLIWDTGSTDGTVEIIKKLIDAKGEKIEFKQVGLVDGMGFTKMRQRMLEQSKGDWVLILDGDEIWWESSIRKVVAEIREKGRNIEGIVVPMVVPVGDIYHIQDEEAGRYNIIGKKGHFSLKAFSKKIPGLHTNWPYGRESFFDSDKRLIQERKKIIFIDAPFLHVTHLKRSNSKRRFNKFKYELGEKSTQDFKFPEVLYKKYPGSISSPWRKISGTDLIKAKLLTPFRKIKRKII